MRPSLFLLCGFSVLMAAISAASYLGYSRDFFGLLTAVPHGLGDKLGHFVLFGLLALLANLATRRRCSLAATLTVTALAVVDEGAQRFVAHRSFDPVDLVASLLGVAVAAGIAATIARRSPATAVNEEI